MFLYWCSISFYNFFGLSVANEFSSVHRTLIDASRTVFVWGIDLLIYYKIDSCVIHCLTRTFFLCPLSTFCDSDYGETWTKYSPMQARQWRCCHAHCSHFLTLSQLGGFLLLITGVFAYNRVFEVPGFRYT